MFFGLQLDRGNIQQALTDDLLTDLKITSNDYNNGTTIQLLCFLAAEFPSPDDNEALWIQERPSSPHDDVVYCIVGTSVHQ